MHTCGSGGLVLGSMLILDTPSFENPMDWKTKT